MKRPGLSLTTGLLFLAAAISLAGEQPGPGLEVFDSATGVEVTSPAPVQTLPPASQPGFDGVTLIPPERPPVIVPDAPFQSDVPFPADQLVPGQTQAEANPFTPDPFGADPYATDPYATDPYAQQGFIGEPYTDPQAADQYAQPPVAAPAAETAYQGELVVYPPDPVNNTIDGINQTNPNFPGLAEQVQARNLQGIAGIVWQVVRERRIVNATMTRGPGGSAGIATQYDLQRAADAINFAPGVSYGDTPLMAAHRVNTILDALESPVVDDYGMGGLMEPAIVRLYCDIFAVHAALAATQDDGVFQELHRTYLRAVTTCDWYNFPRADLIADINAMMARANALFYPDGASTAGDVAGVTSNLFHSALMLDFYSRSDSRFRRDTASVRRTLEAPSRFVLDTALPDGTAPRFGPRGSRELTQVDMAALATMFPKPAPRVTRLGLAASASYPPSSTQATYGGIYVSRSGNEPDARYLAMRFGPYGIQRNVPGHYDFGSLVLMSRNIRFVVDGGGYGGDASLPGAHSVLELEGASIDPASYNVPGEISDAIWRTNASIDYLTDKAAFTDGKSWQRTLAYVKNLPGESRSDYWLILDSVDMNGDPQPRTARIRYQLAPGLQAHHDGAGIVASAGYMDGSSLRFFAINPSTEMTVSEGAMGMYPSHVYDTSGGSYAAPAVNLTRTLAGNDTVATLLYPAVNMQHRPVRIERDADIIRGRTGAVVIDHGNDRVDVVAWSPPGQELVTPTLNLQLSADLAVFRLRKGKIVRMDFVNLERFQAKEPDGGLWSMRVTGPAQTVTVEPEARGGWQIMSDPANTGSATFVDVNLGPGITRSRFGIRPGEMRIVTR